MSPSAQENSESLIRRLGHRVPFARAVRDCIWSASSFVRFIGQFRRFQRLSRGSDRVPVLWRDRLPQLKDRTATTGFDRHYIYHTSWAARVVAETRPAYHVDISSSLYFCGIVSAFVPVRFYDYRPVDLRLSQLSPAPGDLMRLEFPDGSVPSISCMHVVEHVGLGRYGDPLDPSGDLKAMKELKRVVAPGGSLLFVTPVGKPLVRFNAHRIYAYRHIVEAFGGLRLRQFALVPDCEEDGGLIIDATEQMSDGQDYGCGCFWFSREE